MLRGKLNNYLFDARYQLSYKMNEENPIKGIEMLV